jgi:hypothetical protein
LCTLVATPQQDNNRVALEAEIHPVARPKRDAQLKYALANAVKVAEIASLQACQAGLNALSRRFVTDGGEPGFKRRLAMVRDQNSHGTLGDIHKKVYPLKREPSSLL